MFSIISSSVLDMFTIGSLKSVIFLGSSDSYPRDLSRGNFSNIPNNCILSITPVPTRSLSVAISFIVIFNSLTSFWDLQGNLFMAISMRDWNFIREIGINFLSAFINIFQHRLYSEIHLKRIPVNLYLVDRCNIVNVF